MIQRFSKFSLVVFAALMLFAGAAALSPDTALADVGDDSCSTAFTDPCFGNTGDIGDRSCNENVACYGNRGNIADDSCNADIACYSNTRNIDDDSCNGSNACFGGSGAVGSGSCNQSNACYTGSGNVSDSSCNQSYACFDNSEDIGEGSCNQPYACFDNSGDIGKGSCNGYNACFDNGDAIGNYSCNTSETTYVDQCRGEHSPVGDCQYNDEDKVPAVCQRTQCSTEAFELPDSGPGFDFEDACTAHNECTELATSAGDRRACDRQLLEDLQDACTEMWPGGRWSTPPQRRACLNLANAYYNALKLPGGSRGGAWS